MNTIFKESLVEIVCMILVSLIWVAIHAIAYNNLTFSNLFLMFLESYFFTLTILAIDGIIRSYKWKKKN